MSRLGIFGIAVVLTGCGAPPGVEFAEALVQDAQGLIRVKSDGSLFSGQAYLLTCAECASPLLGYWPVHFVGEYKEGLRHGTFWLPTSGSQDDFFEFRDRETQRKTLYQFGQPVDGDVK